MLRKTIIITGTSSGIGKSTAELLSNEYNIIGLSRKQGCDISNISELEKIKANNVYAIINNAALCLKKPFYEYSIQDWETVINTNIRPIWMLSKIFLDQLKKSKGCIVNVSSIHSIATLENNSIYAMSKGAIDAFTRGMAIELANYGIRVNCVRPGATMTPMLGYESGMEETIPLKKIASPLEVANVIKFLISKESSYITGECITVDGGVVSRLSVMK